MVRRVLVQGGVAVAYDSTYEDEEDGWSVVGDDGRNGFEQSRWAGQMWQAWARRIGLVHWQ